MNKTRYFNLVLILLLAFFLRLNGLDFGLPYVLHPDEHQYVEAGIAFLQDWPTLVPQLEKYNNPPLFKIVLGVLYSLYTRLEVPPEQISAAIGSLLWRTFYQYVGRFASASCSLLTVAALYALAKRLYPRATLLRRAGASPLQWAGASPLQWAGASPLQWAGASPAPTGDYCNRQVGMVAALGLAACFLAVRESHFAVNEAALTLLLVLGLYGAAGILRRGEWRDYLGTGLAIGLATATKYTGLQLIAVLPLAHWFHTCRPGIGWRERLFSPRLWSGVVMVPLGFLAAAPLVVVSWPEMIRRIGRLAEYGRFGYHDYLLDAQGGWVFYLKTLGWGAGWLMLAAFAVVLVLTFIYSPKNGPLRRRPEDLLLAISPVLLYVTMASQQMFFARFILPAMPPLILLVAAWLVRCSLAWQRWRPSLDYRVVLAGATFALVCQPLVTSLWFGILLNRPDSRELAAQWLRANVPEGSVIYFDECALPDESVTGEPEWPYAHASQQPFDRPNLMGYYQERRVRYIMVADYCAEVRYTDPTKEEGRKAWQRDLAGMRLVYEFRPYWLPGEWFAFESRLGPAEETLARRYPGPLVRIYEPELPPGWHSLDPFDSASQIADVASVYGWETTADRVAPGDMLDITVYWRNHRWKPRYDLVVALVDDHGVEAARAVAGTAPGFEDELEKKSGHLVKSQAHLLVPFSTPPYAYAVRLSILDRTIPYTVGEIWLQESSIEVGTQ